MTRQGKFICIAHFMYKILKQKWSKNGHLWHPTYDLCSHRLITTNWDKVSLVSKIRTNLTQVPPIFLVHILWSTVSNAALGSNHTKTRTTIRLTGLHIVFYKCYSKTTKDLFWWLLDFFSPPGKWIWISKIALIEVPMMLCSMNEFLLHWQ